ncbi:MAG TPA: hypothetical protein VM053_11620 [Gemmatimonadaceae bacterium]|nr:hypothetical protein [Gemmatimonadaceae bacterium]
MTRNNSLLATAGALVVLACIVPPRAEGQNLVRRLAGVKNGSVRMSFASRDDICGWENSITSNARENRNTRGNWNINSRQSEDVVYDNECSEGPARVVARFENGRVTKIRAYVGGRWRPAGNDVTDAGMVSVKDATDYLLGIARTQSGEAAGEAIFPLTLADSVNMSEPIYSIAKDDSRPNEVRRQAIFWAGQTEASMTQLTELYDRVPERELKDQMIFVFSQRREPAALNKLMDIAKNDKDREARKKAMFWLGQSRDPRVASFLADMINR